MPTWSCQEKNKIKLPWVPRYRNRVCYWHLKSVLCVGSLPNSSVGCLATVFCSDQRGLHTKAANPTEQSFNCKHQDCWETVKMTSVLQELPLDTSPSSSFPQNKLQLSEFWPRVTKKVRISCNLLFPCHWKHRGKAIYCTESYLSTGLSPCEVSFSFLVIPKSIL